MLNIKNLGSIEQEDLDVRAWFIDHGFSYKALGFVDQTRTYFVFEPEAVDRIATTANADLLRLPITAKIVISKFEGNPEQGNYVLKALGGFNEKAALEVLGRHGVYDFHHLPATLWANSPQKDETHHNSLKAPAGPVKLNLLKTVQQYGDDQLTTYAHNSLRGGPRVSYPPVENWIKKMYRTHFSIYKKDKHFPVRNAHFFFLRWEAFMGDVDKAKVDYDFPYSTKDALDFLATQPLTPFTPVLIAAAMGRTRSEYLSTLPRP